MTRPLQNATQDARTEGSDVSIIRREFVALTGDHFSAVILNQLLYWTQRVKDFDLLLEEERQFKPDCNVSPRHGWIYKTAPELNEETMLGLSPPSIRKYLKLLIDEGWIDERNHPTEKWDRTTQYRVNLRKLQEDLFALGRTLPEVYLKAFSSSLSSKGLQRSFEKTEEMPNQRNFASRENLDNSFDEESHLPKETLNQRNFASRENSEETFNEEPHLSKEILNQRNFASNERIFASNQKSFGSNTENTTKTTSENTSKEQQLDAGARENFSDFENSVVDTSASEKIDSGNSCLANAVPGEPAPNESASGDPVLEKGAPGASVADKPILGEPVLDKPILDASVADEMLKHWERHVVQNLPAATGNRRFQLTNERKDQLESLFAFHFQNDIRLWEQFCLRIKASNFLMGGGANGWCVGLDWILREGNTSKVLEGKYDNSKKADSGEWKLEKIQDNPVLDAEKAAIIATIKDPSWRKWCSRLAAGVRLNEFKMVHEPLSVLQLQQIAHAWFLEVEDDRLVWVGSRDQRVLSKIDDLRLHINWVFAKEYPNARTFRTRLEGSYGPQQASIPQAHRGEIHHE